MAEIGIAPQWRLLIVGAGAVSLELAELAPRLGFSVSLCEPREHRRAAWELPGCHWLASDPTVAVTEFSADVHSAIVALTHHDPIDDAVLQAALLGPAFYVGVIGSRGHAEQRRVRLQQAGVPEEQLLRLKAPIGIRIGSRTEAEIAISILAELIAERRAAQAAAEPAQCVARTS